jgi:hypothetical protein
MFLDALTAEVGVVCKAIADVAGFMFPLTVFPSSEGLIKG